MYETIFLWQKCVERSLLCTTWHALCVNESRAFCGTKTVHHNISSSTHCLVAFRQSTTFVHTKHGCERGIYYRSHNPTKSIPLWLWPSMPVMSFSCLTGLQRCCHNCKRSKRDEEARVTETGARKKKIQTHAPLTLHYTLARIMPCLSLPRFVARETPDAAAAGEKLTPNTDRTTDFTVNCLTAASHFCGCLFALAALLLAPRRSKERRFLRTCQVRKSVRASPLVNLETGRQPTSSSVLLHGRVHQKPTSSNTHPTLL